MPTHPGPLVFGGESMSWPLSLEEGDTASIPRTGLSILPLEPPARQPPRDPASVARDVAQRRTLSGSELGLDRPRRLLEVTAVSRWPRPHTRRRPPWPSCRWSAETAAAAPPSLSTG